MLLGVQPPLVLLHSFISLKKILIIYRSKKLTIYQKQLKEPLLAKVTGAVWNNSVVKPIAQANDDGPEDIDKFKKSAAFKGLSD